MVFATRVDYVLKQALLTRTKLIRLSMIVLLAVSAGIISGCAGTAKGKDTSVYSSLKAEKVSDQQQSDASALIVIRYPAMIHADAENLYVSSFAINQRK